MLFSASNMHYKAGYIMPEKNGTVSDKDPENDHDDNEASNYTGWIPQSNNNTT